MNKLSEYFGDFSTQIILSLREYVFANSSCIFLQHNYILNKQNDIYYEVHREQALGISFIRWYKITSKLYQLDQASQDDQLSQFSQRQPYIAQQSRIELNLDLMKKLYTLQKTANLLSVKHNYQRKSLVFRHIRGSHSPKEKKILSK